MKLKMPSKKEPIPLGRQCSLISLSRSRFYYHPTESAIDIKLMRIIDELYTEDPTRGTRRIRGALIRQRNIKNVGRAKISHLMQKMGISAIYPKKNLSRPNKQHKIYPYLLRNVSINSVNQVWSTDITYVRLKNGHVYLTAVIDWYSRKVLSWKLSTTLHSDFCVEALKEAIDLYGTPQIFNTDQGSQFTSDDFIKVLIDNDIKISMDGKGRALDNVFVERLWRTIKYDNIFLNEYRTVGECRNGLKKYLNFYNTKREHQSLDYYNPDEIYFEKVQLDKAA